MGWSDWLDGLRSNLADFLNELWLDPNGIRSITLCRSFALCDDQLEMSMLVGAVGFIDWLGRLQVLAHYVNRPLLPNPRAKYCPT